MPTGSGRARRQTKAALASRKPTHERPAEPSPPLPERTGRGDRYDPRPQHPATRLTTEEHVALDLGKAVARTCQGPHEAVTALEELLPRLRSLARNFLREEG